ncbi:MAG: hypothetical protein WKF34_12240 [Pyrinomonadaceae bacterium]
MRKLSVLLFVIGSASMLVGQVSSTDLDASSRELKKRLLGDGKNIFAVKITGCRVSIKSNLTSSTQDLQRGDTSSVGRVIPPDGMSGFFSAGPDRPAKPTMYSRYEINFSKLDAGKVRTTPARKGTARLAIVDDPSGVITAITSNEMQVKFYPTEYPIIVNAKNADRVTAAIRSFANACHKTTRKKISGSVPEN